MNDLLIGTWVLDPGTSNFDPNHRPSSATMIFERDADGSYRMTAEGVGQNGEQTPNRQKWPGGQAFPQAPQFASSSARFLQPPAQHVEAL